MPLRPSHRSIAWILLGFSLLFDPKALFAVVKPSAYPWYRLSGGSHNMKIDTKLRHIAFTDPEGYNLSFLDLKQKKIFRITRQKTGPSFFFSPDGFRVFYRELIKTKTGSVESYIKAYDISSHQSVEVSHIDGQSGYLTFDPRDLRFQILHKKGILSKLIVFPDERLAKWQMAQRTDEGKFLATPKGMLWLKNAGFTMRKLDDDDSGLQSFDISPDGSSVVWATEAAKVYLSEMGSKPRLIGAGYDPAFHPQKPLIIYAGCRKIGDQIVSTDIRIVDSEGKGRWITNSQSTSERWPRWVEGGESLIYSVAQTTDIYRLDLKL